MAEEPKQIPEKTGREACEARIHNSSNRTIFLIPIQYVYYNYRPPIGIVVKKLVRKIPGGGSIELDRSNDDFNSEIFILFRAGDVDDVEQIPTFFHGWNATLKSGEMLFLIGHLDNLSLECNDWKVIGSNGAGLPPPPTIAKASIREFREAPIRESTPSQERRRVIVPCQIPEWVLSGLKAPRTKIHNNSHKPISLIRFSWVGGPDPQSDGVVRQDRVKKIPARIFIEYDAVGNNYDYGSKIRILFRAGHTNNDEEFPGNLKVEPGEELYSPHYLSEKGELFLSFNEAGQVKEVDKNSEEISGMDFFRNAQAVRLRNCYGQLQFLVADDDEETVALRSRDDENKTDKRTPGRDGPWSGKEMQGPLGDSQRRRDKRRRWYVEKSASVLHLKSCHNKYLTASALSSLDHMTGCQVLQSSHSAPDFSPDLEPVKVGSQVKLCTNYDTFLCANSRPPYKSDLVTHDLYPSTAIILWDVEVAERVEGTATNIDDKASEEGSTSDIDDKASSPTKRRYETGEGSSVTKSPSGVSGLIREGYGDSYRRHFWELKRRLVDNSGRKDILVWGGSGTTALVRDVCADVRERFATIAWISIPRENDSAFIREEILVQLISERAASCESFKEKPWMLDHQFPLKQEARCLIVVDNLDDLKTWERFKDIWLKVKTCRVICIARSNMGSSASQMEKHRDKFKKHGLECEIYELVGLPPPADYLKNFLEKEKVHQLIVKKCQRLPTAIVFVLCNKKICWRDDSSTIWKDQWEARIPSDNLPDEFRVIQQVLETLHLHPNLDEGEGHERDLFQEVLWFILKDAHKFCLLYLSILPEDVPISCETIFRLWAAEGVMTTLGRVKHFIKEVLVQKNWIKPVELRSDGRLSKFQVDKRVREIIVSLSDLHDPETITITSQGSTNWPERVKYLFVRGEIRDFNLGKTFKLSSVSVLDVSSNKDKTTTSEARQLETSETPSFPSTPKCPKEINLTGAPFQAVPDALFELTDARYFCLRDGPIKAIPSSIEKLKHLEFLDAKHSLVTELPSEAEKLENIRHILIYHHEKDPLTENYNLIGFKALCRVQGFKCLEKLCFVEADETTLKDLVNLTKLRRLGITKLKYGDGKLLCTSLAKLKELKSLNVHALEEEEIIDLSDLSSPPQNLERLYLHGRLEKLPDWISSLNYLKKIILRWSQLEQDLLATLGKLGKLLVLELRRAYAGEKLDFNKQQFPNLKILLLEELEGLRSMSLEQQALPKLESLTINRCQWLEGIPSGIEDIPKIRKLAFFNMSHEFYKKVKADHEKNNYTKFKHIKEVYFKRWKAGYWETHSFPAGEGDEGFAGEH